MLSFRRCQVTEHLLPIPLPMATTLLWRTPPCHPGKTEHPMDESSQGTNPCLRKATTAAVFGIDRRGGAFCITEVLGAKPQSIPQCHEGRALAWDLGKVQPNFTPRVASLAPKLVLSSELKSWSCLYICWVPKVWSTNHKGDQILRIKPYSYTQLSAGPGPNCCSSPSGNLGKWPFLCKFLPTEQTHTQTGGCEIAPSPRVLLQAELSPVENGRFNHRPSLQRHWRRQFSTCSCPKQRHM